MDSITKIMFVGGINGKSSMYHVRFSVTLKGVLIYNYEICEK